MVSVNYYVSEWRGAYEGDNEELQKLLSHAEIIVSSAIGKDVNRYSFPESIKLYVMNAVCAEADHIYNNGGFEECGTFTLGKFSIGVAGGNGAILSTLARTILLPTGLLYRGC